MVHQNVAHLSWGDSEKLRSILPIHALVVHQPKVRLIHQRSGLQRMALPLDAHVAVRDPPQLFFNQRDQLV
jgi:hypothetical protein